MSHKFLIEVEVIGCDNINRQRVAEVLGEVIDNSNIATVLDGEVFESPLFGEHNLAKPQYEGGECPDSGEPIPDDATAEESCANCGHVWAWDGHDQAPGVERIDLLEDGSPLNAPHLTVYIDRERGEDRFCVDEDHPDDEHGRRRLGVTGVRFQWPTQAGDYVASMLENGDEALALGKYVSIWDGGTAIRSRCTVNLKTREVVIHDSYDIDVDVLDQEYVELINDETYYPAANESSRDEYSQEDQEGMFFYK